MDSKIIPIIAALTITLSQAEEREWSRGEGQEPLTAEFVCLDKATRGVILMLSDGEEVTVPYAKLAKEDQDFVKESAKSLADEAKKRKCPLEVSEIFSAGSFSPTFIATTCYSIGDRSKLPDIFMVMGDVKDRGGKTVSDLKATLTLVRFIDIARNGGVAKRPLYRAANVRPAPPRNVRDAQKGR